MAQFNGQTDNHNMEREIISPSDWGRDIEIDKELVRRNLLDIQNKIAPCKPRIIGVTKYFGLNAIVKGYEAGIRDFGESRAADAVQKIEMLPEHIRKTSTFHYIGHLQSNKVGKVVRYFDYIHSIDSLKLAGLVSKISAENSKTTKILLQLNNAEEEQKFGYSKTQLKQDFSEILKLSNVEVVGLMNMAPLGAEPRILKSIFKDLRLFRDELEEEFKVRLPELSMGMSDDYVYAVEEGATMIRIGRKLFK